MPGTSAIRFAFAGALLGVVGAVAALTLPGGDGSAPVAASPGKSTSAVSEPGEPTETTTVRVPRKSKVTVDVVREQTVATYASCADAVAATADQAVRYDGSSATLAALGSAALRTSEQCAQTAAKLQDELQAAASTDDGYLLEAVARCAGLAQRQAASAGSLAIGLASPRSPRRAARAYTARGARLAAGAQQAHRSLERARLRSLDR